MGKSHASHKMEHKVNSIRADEVSIKQNIGREMSSLKSTLKQIRQNCRCQPQIGTQLEKALEHIRMIEESVSQTESLYESWKEQFKARIRKRLKVFK